MEPEEYLVDTIYLATGTTVPPGGMQAGMPASDVRVTHIITGIMAQCGIHKSPHKNKQACLSMIEWALSEANFERAK